MKTEAYPIADEANLWGFSLRLRHATDVVAWPRLPCLELLVEHFAWQSGGPGWRILHELLGRAPLSLHGLHLDIGGLDPLNKSYLVEVRRLCEVLKPMLYSDHLAFTQLDGQQTFDLLPIPLTRGHQLHVIERVRYVQDFLGRPLGLENISAYRRYPQDSIPELEFLQGIADATGCLILLDVNNLHVNAHNFSFSVADALSSLEASSIAQYHTSGHSSEGHLLHDTHDQNVCDPVWDILKQAVKRFGSRPLILERDDEGVTLATIQEELKRGQRSLL